MTTVVPVNGQAGFFIDEAVTPERTTDLLSAIEAAEAMVAATVNDAAVSAAQAAVSATDSATSATAAAGSASGAVTSATTATDQAVLAASSATTAGTSATSASTSATTASTQASNAATSATNSASSATSSSTSATASAASASAAAGSATTAAGSATAANASAISAAASATTATNQAAIATSYGTGILTDTVLTGTPTAPTAAPGTNTTQLATTAYTTAAVAVETSRATTAEGLLAPKASPTLTGVPLAPTASALTNNTQLATTAYADTAVGVETTRALAGEAANYGRNLIHNGEFLVAQRGVGPFTGSGTYGLDRWVQTIGGNTTLSTSYVTIGLNGGVGGDEAAVQAMNCTWTTGSIVAGDLAVVEQRMEGVQRYAGKNLTISFWAQVPISGTPKIGVGLQQNFGSGGSPSSAVNVNATAVTLSTTWTKFTVTLAVPSVSGKTLGSTAGTDYTAVRFFMAAGTTNNTIAGSIGDQASNTFRVWGVQAELGSVATALEKISYPVQLAQCQRFYVADSTDLIFSFNAAGAASTNIIYLPYPMTMRASPTRAIGSTSSNVNITSVTFTGANSASHLGLVGTATAGGSASIVIAGFTATADL